MFYNISHVLNHAPVYATILFDIDDQYRAVLNASTSDAGTYTEVSFGQFEKALSPMFVTSVTLFRYTWVKLAQLWNARLPINKQFCKLIDVNEIQNSNAISLTFEQFGKLTDIRFEQ